MASNSRVYKYYTTPMAYFVDKIRTIPYSGLGITYTGETQIQGGVMVLLKHGVSFSSWGEEIKVCITIQNNQTCVDVYSECAMPTQIVDWGKNSENVSRIFAFLEQGMPLNNQQYQQYQQQQQQYQQQQQQYQQPQQQYQQPQQQYQQPQQQYQQPQYQQPANPNVPHNYNNNK